MNSPSRKIFRQEEALILDLHNCRNLGARRIQNELLRLHEINLSLASIHKVLKRNNTPLLQKKRHYRKQVKRYSCKIPRYRIQVDVIFRYVCPVKYLPQGLGSPFLNGCSMSFENVIFPPDVKIKLRRKIFIFI